MKTFNWDKAEQSFSPAQLKYLKHVSTKNIELKDFVRGYRTLPFNTKLRSIKQVTGFYIRLKEHYGFFKVDK